MKKIILDILICPRCLPEEIRLSDVALETSSTEILTGRLHCGNCGSDYPIEEGIAFLEPDPSLELRQKNRYETMPVVSSYLWSHFGDLMKDDEASNAYREWASLIEPHGGFCLDAGSAVGRFTFEMAQKADFAVGIDNAIAFIRTARELMLSGEVR
jgi:uncharacterized protein YbaR (Trm112 family)